MHTYTHPYIHACKYYYIHAATHPISYGPTGHNKVARAIAYYHTRMHKLHTHIRAHNHEQAYIHTCTHKNAYMNTLTHSYIHAHNYTENTHVLACWLAYIYMPYNDVHTHA